MSKSTHERNRLSSTLEQLREKTTCLEEEGVRRAKLEQEVDHLTVELEHLNEIQVMELEHLKKIQEIRAKKFQ